jgi:imidazolonepropionase-like amidohydrolase
MVAVPVDAPANTCKFSAQVIKMSAVLLTAIDALRAHIQNGGSTEHVRATTDTSNKRDTRAQSRRLHGLIRALATTTACKSIATHRLAGTWKARRIATIVNLCMQKSVNKSRMHLIKSCTQLPTMHTSYILSMICTQVCTTIDCTMVV